MVLFLQGRICYLLLFHLIIIIIIIIKLNMDCVSEQLLFIALAGDAVEEKHFGFHVDVRSGIEVTDIKSS